MSNIQLSPQVMEPSPALVQVNGSLKSSIESKLTNLRHADSSGSYAVCIYRISKKHRKVNEEAYTPRLVSIGPLHHGKSHLLAMEVYKLRCLDSFMSRFKVDLHILVEFAEAHEISARGCYEGTIELSPKVFSEMILLDGVFIVELFIKKYYTDMRNHNDTIFENRWMSSDLMHDMLLLENQLPMSVALGIFTFVDRSVVRLSFYQLAWEYFNEVGNTKGLSLTTDCNRSRHLVELLVYLHRSSGLEKKSSRREKCELARSVTELHEAGVKFNSGKGGCLLEVLFAEGVLTIPRVTINDWTETFFRNLIAFEQCGYYPKDLTSYIILMDSLIDTPKDVDLLVKGGIIENLLCDSQQVADLFNNLYKEVVTEDSDFYFAELCGELNKYSRDYWHQWKSTWFRWKLILRRDYFNNPWTFFSVAAAVIALILTIIQTVCSLKSV